MSEDVLDPRDKDSESPRPRGADSPRLRVAASPHLPVPPSDARPVSRSRFSTHVAWTLAVRVLMTVNSIAAGIIVARWLGAEGLGQLAVINVAVATFVQLGSAGLPSANIYFIAQDRRRLVPVAMNSLVFALAAGGVLGLGLSLLASARPAWFGFVSPSLVTIAAVSIPFQLITVIGLNIFLALGRVEAFNLLDLIGQAFVVINAVVVLIVFSSGLWTLVSFNTAVTVAIALLIIALVTVQGTRQAEKKAWRTDGELFRRMIRYGIKFHISILAGALIFRADLLVVNYFRGAAEAGVYSVASQVAMMLMLLPGVIGTLLFPRITSDRDPHGELTSRVTRHTAFIMLMVCLATTPLSLMLPELYGRAFAEASIQLLILLPGVFLIGIESVLAQHFSAIGLPRTIPVFWLITLFVNLVLVLALVPPFGGRGAAAASTVSYTLIFGLIIFYFRRQSGTSIPDILFINGLELRQLVSGASLGRRHLK